MNDNKDYLIPKSYYSIWFQIKWLEFHSFLSFVEIHFYLLVFSRTVQETTKHVPLHFNKTWLFINWTTGSPSWVFVHWLIYLYNTDLYRVWDELSTSEILYCYFSNTAGHNMFDPFEQHNQTCWIVLDGVGRCWMKFDFVQKYAIILCPVLKSNIVGWCWIYLNTPAFNTIQHWSNTVQHHPTRLDNVWPTCLWFVWTGLNPFSPKLYC